jgi:putative SOS response-associated peptidase YedK
MCGRVVQASDPLRFAIVDGLSMPDSRAKPSSYNVAPSQLLYVIRENHETGERTLDLLRWGPNPAWLQGPRRWAQADQRARRIDGATPDLPRSVC